MKRVKKVSDWSIQWKFVLIFILFVLAPILAFNLHMYSQANRAVQLQAVNNTKEHLEKVNRTISAVLKDIESISMFLIYDDDVRAYLKLSDGPDHYARLRGLEEQLNGYAVYHLMSKPYLHSLSLSGLHHQFHVGVHPDEFESREAAWRREAVAKRGASLWTNVYPVRDGWNREAEVISLFRAINDINNVTAPIGMVAIRLDVKKLYDYIRTDFRDLAEMIVVDREGTIVMHPDARQVGGTLKGSPLSGLLAADPGRLAVDYRDWLL